jgi:hypothetical protein
MGAWWWKGSARVGAEKGRGSKTIFYMKRIFILIPILAILSVFTGCKTKTILVPVEKVKIEYRDRLRVDSVYNRDTVNIYERGDTVFLQTIKWRERFKFDTVIVVRTDSIPYPVEVVREVNVLTKWQRLRLNALNILVIIIAAYLFIKIKLS